LADEIHKIIKDQGKTAILVTHDISEAISMADRVMVMSKRPSTISSVYPIQMDEGSDLSPWKKREANRYKEYFNSIWRELETHVVSSS
jgi:NitT/TauT family transport system ATP-binding protein